MTSLAFLGAARTVTGSKFLIMHNGMKIMIDCGLFQGRKVLRKRNWDDFLKVNGDVVLKPEDIDYIILTHAHIDHSGYIPRFVKQGFKGKILCTQITKELCELLLKDSAYLQEEEARYANKKGYSKHRPALPLYRVADAVESFKYFKPVERNEFINLSPDIRFRFRNAGHILGSCIVEMWIKQEREEIKVVFSGDLGRMKTPILKDPDYVREVDYLILESTYGDRLHSAHDPGADLIPLIKETYKNRSVLLIPAFAVERTQELIYILRGLRDKKLIPRIPIYIDSPLAINVTKLFESHREVYDKEARALIDDKGKSIFNSSDIHFTSTCDESKALNGRRGPMIIISASGMATGGRILHHLKERLPDYKNNVLMVGYQAAGTRGRSLLDGAKTVKIHGNYIPVRAKVTSISTFSAHADYSEILKWLRSLRKNGPRKVFLAHGEINSQFALAYKIKEEYGWDVYIPDYLETVLLDREYPLPPEGRPGVL
ncbi:MAG: MBL fold metallo-hydrolase [Candidatus Eremiobacteraeota bacterium]|nr:MBL fold metallo-hydrolase [Candidatus Eremiobacteraeota bacterium]